ncbi:MAG: tRNA (guanosine(37)-N1)-methyltransferase TrmD [Spirochaetales bacterium]|nr:tRNA (guanosine(37)-N1)-methyltransferase TrmD [Spirochaetales bacterium]
MIFHILTLFPEAFEGYRSSSILGKATERRLVELELVDIRRFARDRHRTCDDAPYGGGAGMVLKPEPLAAALESVGAREAPGACAGEVAPSGLSLQGNGPRVVYLSPAGRLWSQAMAETVVQESEVVLICGRYEGIDQRIIDMYATDEISVGDYILSGGEVAAMVLIDTVVRLVPGVIKEESLAEESLGQGLLEYPHYTRPQEFRGRKVPEVLLSGNHAEIQRWRLERSREKTRTHRPELLSGRAQAEGDQTPAGGEGEVT